MSKNSFFPSALAFAITALSASACNLIDFDYYESFGVCHEDRHCESWQSCIEQYCVDKADKSIKVIVKTQFQNSAQTIQTTSATLTHGSPLPTISEHPETELEVQLYKSALPLPANVRFTKPLEFCNLKYTQTVTLDGIHATQSSLPSGNYQVEVFPDVTNPELPPLPNIILENIQIQPNQKKLDLNLNPDENDYFFLLTGTLIYESTKPLDSDSDIDSEIRPKSIKIHANDINSAQNSISHDLCNEQGCKSTFQILLPPQTAGNPKTYTLTAHIKLSDLLTITQTLDQAAFTLEKEEVPALLSDTYEHELPVPYVIYLPDLVKHQGLLGLEASSAAKSAVINITGTTNADSLPISFSVLANAPTDENGYFAFEYPVFPTLPPMQYTIDVKTDLQSNIASQTYSFDAQLPENILLETSPKTKFQAKIYGQQTQPLAAAKILLTPHSTSLHTIETNTNDSGFFTAYLNHVPYTLTVIPPKSEHLPTKKFEITYPLPKSSILEFTIGSTSIAYGYCKDEHQKFAQNAEIELLYVDNEDQCHSLATTSSDKNGFYKVVIPNLDLLD